MKLTALLLTAIVFLISACAPAQPGGGTATPAAPTASLPALSTQPPVPTRAAGATPAPVIMDKNLFPSGSGEKQYMLSVAAGQTVTVAITSDGVPLSLIITSPSGAQRLPEVTQAAGGYRIDHRFVANETGSYRLTLNKVDHTPSTNYTVTVTMQ